jgi:hypothetical protein
MVTSVSNLLDGPAKVRDYLTTGMVGQVPGTSGQARKPLHWHRRHSTPRQMAATLPATLLGEVGG